MKQVLLFVMLTAFLIQNFAPVRLYHAVFFVRLLAH